ncbi:MAG: phosphoribosylglycinamide formyltransferase [bacterium]|nr:phosphoribosylglycinamide formyltransferase [bacterium]
MEKLKIGALVSGGGTNLQAIIDACEAGLIDGEFTFVGSDRPGVFGLERAKKHGIPTFVVDYSERMDGMRELGSHSFFKHLTPKDFNSDEIFNKLGKVSASDYLSAKFIKLAIIESELLKEMAKYQFDLLVLAGFMRMLSPYFIDKINIDPWKLRIMNIHPALLPNFPGMHGYEDTWNYGCTVGGCTVHFVDYGEDTGPIIMQGSFNRLPGDTLETFSAKGLAIEHEVYPRCIQLFAQGRLKLVEGVLRGGATRKLVEILPGKTAIEVLDEGAEFELGHMENCPGLRCRR